MSEQSSAALSAICDERDALRASLAASRLALAAALAGAERLRGALRDLGHDWCRERCDGDQHTDECCRALAALAAGDGGGGGGETHGYADWSGTGGVRGVLEHLAVSAAWRYGAPGMDDTLASTRPDVTEALVALATIPPPDRGELLRIVEGVRDECAAEALDDCKGCDGPASACNAHAEASEAVRTLAPAALLASAVRR